MKTSLVITSEDLKNLNKATFDAFIQSGKYTLTLVEAYSQFGKPLINTLITNKLLHNMNRQTSGRGAKHRYLISDIIAAIKAWEVM